MLRYAIKMMIGDRAKFFGIVIGLSFATFVITQQGGIFFGLMKRTYGFISDTSQADLWIMNKHVNYVDEVEPSQLSKLYQIRGVEGIEWAEPIFKGRVEARTFGNGDYQSCQLVGINAATLIGAPALMTEGTVTNLHFPDAILVNEEGRKLIGYPSLGDTFEINDRRAKITGFFTATRTFATQPIVYTTFDRALSYARPSGNFLTFVIAKAKKGVKPKELAKRISSLTDMAAFTSHDFAKLTVLYYLFNTGILLNFGIAVLLGFIIGIAISGQTFYNFAHDNRHFFATFKAMGAKTPLLIRMVIIQALMTGVVSWGLGIGAAALFGFTSAGTELSFILPWWLFLASFFSVLIITILSALLALFKITRVDPGIVFQT